MEYCQEFVEINCSYDAAFNLFSDPMRLPEWAIAYCHSIREVNGGFVAETVEGGRCVNTRCDRSTGVADICSGASHDKLDDILYIRVTAASPSQTLVHFVYPPPGKVPTEVLELMETGLKSEIVHTKKLLEQT